MYSVTSCDLRVLMDQPTDPIPSHDPPGRQHDRWFGRPQRRRLPQGAVRPVAVVVIDVLGQHRLQDAHTVLARSCSGSRGGPALRGCGDTPGRVSPASRSTSARISAVIVGRPTLVRVAPAAPRQLLVPAQQRFGPAPIRWVSGCRIGSWRRCRSSGITGMGVELHCAPGRRIAAAQIKAIVRRLLSRLQQTSAQASRTNANHRSLSRSSAFWSLVTIIVYYVRTHTRTPFGIYSGPSRSRAGGGHRGEYVKLCVQRARAMRASDEVTGARSEGLGLHARPWRHADP